MTRTARRSPPDDETWERASEAQRAVAASRLAAVRRSDALHAGGLSRADADALAAGEANASPKSVRRWRAAVRDRAPGDCIAALLDAPRPGRPSMLDAELTEALEALIAHFGDHLTAPHAHRTLIARYGWAPAVSTVREWIARWRAENARDLSAVTNPDRHRSHRKPAGGDAAAHIVRLNQLWELDSTPADAMCADGKRHAIVGAIDVWSRRTKLLVAPSSRAIAIALLLRRCMLDWGVPEVVRTDEGRDYTSRHVLGVLKGLELAHDPCPPYTPEAKPFIERFLGTLARDLFAFLPGFTGHDVADAAAIRARKSYAARRGEEDVVIYGCTLTAEELQARCDVWCEAVYERRPHDGLGGDTPFARAASWAGSVRRIHDERALDALLAAPAGSGWRTVGKDGIRLNNVDYIAGPLGAIVGERVQVRHDPADLDRIHVYRADGAFICVAEDPVRTGTDRAEIAGRMKVDYSAHGREARKRARELAKLHRPERSMDDVLAHATREADRVVTLPRKGETHETPALAEAARAAKAAEVANADAAPVSPSVRAARRRVAAANRHFLQEDDSWLR